VCGRYSLHLLSLDDIASHFAIPEIEIDYWGPRFNIAPTQNALVVTGGGAGGGRRLRMLRWGLVPSWARDRGMAQKLINARVETLASKPSFRSAYRRRRCAVPMSGFYEWKKVPRRGAGRGPRKQPLWIHREDRGLLAAAGLWERWSDPQLADASAPLDTFTIVTRPAEGALLEVHDRMPLFLGPEVLDRWLEERELDEKELASWLEAGTSFGGLTMHEVDPRMSSPGFEDPSCIEPLASAQPPQLALFDDPGSQ